MYISLIIVWNIQILNQFLKISFLFFYLNLFVLILSLKIWLFVFGWILFVLYYFLFNILLNLFFHLTYHIVVCIHIVNQLNYTFIQLYELTFWFWQRLLFLFIFLNLYEWVFSSSYWFFLFYGAPNLCLWCF